MFAGDLIVQVVGNRLIVRMPEVFGTETLKKGLMAIYEHAQWRDMNELWDFRASIRSDVDFGSMGELIEFMAQHRGERRHEKTAMLFNARARELGL